MIEFPKLGLRFTIDRVAFKVFGIPIYWYGMIIALGFLLAVVLGMRRSKKDGIDPENVIDLVLIAVPVSIVFARLYYVVFNWSEFSGNPISILNTRMGGLAIYGGIIGAFLSAMFFARWKKIKILKLLDFGVPYLVLAQAIGRWGNFVNQEAFGTNTTLPWGMTGDAIKKQLTIYQLQGMEVTPNLPVHPTFLYESLLNLSIFLFLIWFRNRKKIDGEVMFLYLILYGIGRFFIEGLRTDSLMLGSFRVSQLLSFILVIVFVTVFIIGRKKLGNMNEENIEIGSSSYGSVLKKLEEEVRDSDKEPDGDIAVKTEADAVEESVPAGNTDESIQTDISDRIPNKEAADSVENEKNIDDNGKNGK